MKAALAVAVLALVACAEGPTGPTPVVAPEPPSTAVITPTPTPSPEPTPEPEGPTYWEAYVTEDGWLRHRNLGGHMQHVTACAYRAHRLIEDGPGEWDRLPSVNGRQGDAAPRVILSLFPFPPSSWAWEPQVEVQIFGLVGLGRACTPTPAGIGNITTRRTILWPPPRKPTP